jgi:hypothetical protein
LNKKGPQDERAKVKAVGREVRPLAGERVAAPGMKLLSPPIPMAPLQQLLKELDQDRQDRD